MKIEQLRIRIQQMSESEVQTEYDQYRTLQSKGVRDEIMFTLLEDELYNRTELM
jgi:hypothetical protein